MAWDLLTNVFKLPKDRLYVTYEREEERERRDFNIFFLRQSDGSLKKLPDQLNMSIREWDSSESFKAKCPAMTPISSLPS